MIEQTPAGLARQAASAADLDFSRAEKETLRRLAGQVAEIAARPLEETKRELWYQHNALQPTRPVIFCDPENGWNEIITPEQMECVNATARNWEMTLRKEIWWGTQMRDDRVIAPYFTVSYVYSESDWGMHETRIGGENGGAYVWDAPLKDYADMDKLHAPRITVDQAGTAGLKQLAEEILGDLLTVRVKSAWWWSLGMTWTLVKLRGLGQMMYDMIDRPADLHRLMAFLRDGHLAMLDYLEQNGLLSLNNDDTYVGSGGFGWTHELPAPGFGGRVRTRDLWGFCESQETVGVSPAMFEEFVFQYQLPILERFGLNCYGCCEPLDKRWSVVSRTPRLRRVSVSPWASIPAMAEMLGDRYILSYKPRPADLAMLRLDEEMIRRDLREAMQAARNARLEVIMKDNHTIGNDPRRVIRWVEIAREEAERV